MDIKSRYIIYIAILLAILTFSFIPFGGGDNFKYYSLSNSLVEGHYRELWTPDNPIHTHYPIGFPALLIPAWSLTSAKSIVFLCFIGALFIYGILMKEHPNPVGLSALILFSFSLMLLEYSHHILSEVPYITFSLLALLFLQRKRYMFALLFALLTFYIRTIGITLVFTIALIAMLEERKWYWIPISLVGISGYFINGFVNSNNIGHSYMYIAGMINPYRPELGYLNLGGWVHRFAINFVYWPFLLGYLWKLGALGIILFCIMLLGIREYRNRNLLIYAGLYLLIILNWSASSDIRMYLPLLPIFALWVAYGLYAISQKMMGGNRNLIWIITLFAINSIIQTAIAFPKIFKDNRVWITKQKPPLSKRHTYLYQYSTQREKYKANKPKTSRKPAMFYHFTGLKTNGIQKK